MPTAQWGVRPVDGETVYAAVPDVTVVAQKLAPASLKLQTKAGVPSDGDIVGGAADGDIVIDTANSQIYVRIGGTWKKTVALT